MAALARAIAEDPSAALAAARWRSEGAFSQRLADFFEKGMQAFADQQSQRAKPTMLNRLIRVPPHKLGLFGSSGA